MNTFTLINPSAFTELQSTFSGEIAIGPDAEVLRHACGLEAGAMAAANDEVAIFGMAEDLEAVGNISAILAEPELDGLFVGLVDLTAAMGLIRTSDVPAVRAQDIDLLKQAAQVDKAPAIHASTPEAAAFWFSQGARFVTIACDADLIGRAFRGLVHAVVAAQK